jgi:hypothetical protein
MGKIIDANALYNIGRATTGDVRDNRARDAFMAVLGAKALQLIGNAFVTRQKGRKKGAETITNAKNEITESDYDLHIQNIATDEVNGHKQLLNKAANLEAIGKVQQAVEIRNKVDTELKRLKQGADFIKSKGGIFKQMYEKSTFTTSKGDMKVSINPASSAMSQQHGASFADGSIYQSFDFMEYEGKKQWVLVGEEQVTDQISKPTYTPLSELEMPELNEKKVINDYKNNNAVDLQKAGQISKTGVFDEKNFRDATFNNINELTPNQLSSYWYSPSGDEVSAPVLKYITQPEGFMLNGQKHPAVLDPNEQGLSPEEIQRRELVATGVMEELKKEDWASHEKVTWLVDNEIMPSAREAFQKGVNNQPEKVTKPTKRSGITVDGYPNTDYNDAVRAARKMGVEGDVSFDLRGLRKFVNVGNGMTQVYLQDDKGGYNTKGDLLPVNEALALRGLGVLGIGYKSTPPKEQSDLLKFGPTPKTAAEQLDEILEIKPG